MLYIIRGLPGSGKTTLARKLADVVTEADHFMINAHGEYEFDPTKLRECHEHCRSVAEAALANGAIVAVSNTFSRRWELQPYISLAQSLNIPYQIITVQGHPSWKNIHNVPDHTIQRMKARWEV
jgi:predicted kinase